MIATVGPVVRRIRRRILLATLVAFPACSAGQIAAKVSPAPSSPVGPSAPPTTIPAHRSVVAAASVPDVAVFSAPGASVPAQTLHSPRPLGGPLVFLVVGHLPGWEHVLLPVRPNGSKGWVRSGDVTLTNHDYWIVVSIAAHRIAVYRDDTVVDQEPIGLGAGATPTPGGLYYTVDFVRVTGPPGPYGPYAYGLSGFSDVLTSFGGGPGQLAIHGTDDPSGLGHDVSHGCIRMSNAGITRLAGILPLGVPVRVVA